MTKLTEINSYSGFLAVIQKQEHHPTDSGGEDDKNSNGVILLNY